MPSSEFWLSLLEQTLLRGGGWLLLLLLLAPVLRRVSAARRALGWQMAFVSLILLPMLLVWTPPLPLGHGEPLPADSMTAASTRRQSAPAPALPASRIRQEAVRPEHSIGDSVPIHGVAITMASPPAPASYRLSVIGLPSLLMLFWGIGAAFFFVRVVTGLVTLRRWGCSRWRHRRKFRRPRELVRIGWGFGSRSRCELLRRRAGCAPRSHGGSGGRSSCCQPPMLWRQMSAVAPPCSMSWRMSGDATGPGLC